MSDALPPEDRPEDGMDAAPGMMEAELALGLLDGNERAAAMRRLLSDRAFAAEVELWRGHFAQLFDLWPEAAAPEGLWARIEQSLDGAVVTPVVADLAPASNGWVWPSIAGLTSIVAAASLFVVVDRPTPVPVAPAPHAAPVASVPSAMLVASIAPTEKGAPVTAVYDPASGAVRLTSSAFADATRSQELWVIAGDGVPHSLGLLRGTGTSLAVKAGDRARLAPGSVLAVSLEPVGGSPTGLPTGPVVAKGALSQV
jgi:anti-sigma-K factor RskA